MKKNLLTVITFVLVLINLILTGVLAFIIVPEASKANELITKVVAAIDLELEAGDTESSSASNYSVEQIEVYDVKGDGDKTTITVNLKKGSDGKDHFAVVGVALSLNTESEDYSKYKETLDAKASLIKSEIINVISQYTLEEVKSNQDKICDEITKRLQTMFNSEDFIVDVNFSSATYQ